VADSPKEKNSPEMASEMFIATRYGDSKLGRSPVFLVPRAPEKPEKGMAESVEPSAWWDMSRVGYRPSELLKTVQNPP
jgi:hypothetical protein